MIVVQSSGPAGCAILRDLPPVWPLLAGSRARRSEQMGRQRTHTHRLGGRAVNIYSVHHAEVIRFEHKMVYNSMLVAPDNHGKRFSCVGGGGYVQ